MGASWSGRLPRLAACQRGFLVIHGHWKSLLFQSDLWYKPSLWTVLELWDLQGVIHSDLKEFCDLLRLRSSNTTRWKHNEKTLQRAILICAKSSFFFSPRITFSSPHITFSAWRQVNDSKQLSYEKLNLAHFHIT